MEGRFHLGSTLNRPLDRPSGMDSGEMESVLSTRMDIGERLLDPVRCSFGSGSYRRVIEGLTLQSGFNGGGSVSRWGHPRDPNPYRLANPIFQGQLNRHPDQSESGGGLMDLLIGTPTLPCRDGDADLRQQFLWFEGGGEEIHEEFIR